MYEVKKIGKVLTSKSVGTGPSSYEKRIYRATVSQRLRNTGLDKLPPPSQVLALLLPDLRTEISKSFIVTQEQDLVSKNRKYC